MTDTYSSLDHSEVSALGRKVYQMLSLWPSSTRLKKNTLKTSSFQFRSSQNERTISVLYTETDTMYFYWRWGCL